MSNKVIWSPINIYTTMCQICVYVGDICMVHLCAGEAATGQVCSVTLPPPYSLDAEPGAHHSLGRLLASQPLEPTGVHISSTSIQSTWPCQAFDLRAENPNSHPHVCSVNAPRYQDGATVQFVF